MDLAYTCKDDIIIIVVIEGSRFIACFKVVFGIDMEEILVIFEYHKETRVVDFREVSKGNAFIKV